MKKASLQDSAARLRIAVLVLLVLMVGAYGIARLGIDLGPGVKVESRPVGSGAPVPAFAADVAVILFAMSLWRLAQMLRLLGRGERFTRLVAAAFRSFAFWLLLAALAQTLLPIAASVLLTASDHGRIALAFDLLEIFFIIAALVLFLVVRMLEEAAELDAELKEIV